MKKLLKKKYFVPLLVVAVMLIAAAGAYAVWANQDSLDGNTISTGGVDITASDTAMHFDGLMPGSAAPAQYMWVRNDSTAPIMMYAYVRVTEGDPALTNYVNAEITLAPHDFPTDACHPREQPWIRGRPAGPSTRASSQTFLERQRQAVPQDAHS